ncbi:MAG: DDE-type integrase/transposase/recombinase [Actinobacteria bacterium]|nr:DDE-type integrase/transposase/recombinase [Actinomycetota bacterium]
MLNMRHKKEITAEVQARYKKAKKKQKKIILDEFVALTSYNRNYASRVLRLYYGKQIGGIGQGKRKIRYVIGKDKRKKKDRKRFYSDDVTDILKKIWAILDMPCGKRLAPFMEEIILKLETFSEIEMKSNTKQKLLAISASTIDRLLKPIKEKLRIGKGRSSTKPGTLLKHQIPIKTFSDWDSQKPGFLETDLVSHEGGNFAGDFCFSINFVDIATSWDETIAIRNKAQVWVTDALDKVAARFPFDILGLDSDNGSEFINSHFVRYCQKHKITFTRSRPYKKNDSCYVEQKNYCVVRKAVGYLRYDTSEELKLLNDLYSILRLYINFFIPVRKLISKTRTGAKISKIYDDAKTPYRRVLESKHIGDRIKTKLRREYDSLNPAALKRKITKLQNKLVKLNALKRQVLIDVSVNDTVPGY